MARGPQTLVGYVSPRCTARCAFCTGEGQPLASKDLDRETLEICFEIFPSIESVCLAGLGEPLMADGLPELIDYCAANGRLVSLITNGHLVAKRFDEIDWRKLLYVSVSVNEVSEQAYKDTTGVDRLPDVEEAVEMLRGVAPLTASFVVGSDAVTRIPAAIEWCAEHGVQWVSFVNLLPRLRLALAESDSVYEVQDPDKFWGAALTQEHGGREFGARAKEIVDLAARRGVMIQSMPTVTSRTHFPHPSQCLSPFTSLGVDGDGNVSLCRRVMGPSLRQGNVLRDGRDAWFGAEAAAFREAHEEGLVPPICRACFGAWSG